MSTVKRYIGQRSTLEIKQEILKDFQEALNLELNVELKTSDKDNLFTRPNFGLKLDNGITRFVYCDIFALIQCFRLKEKKKIDKALIKAFNNHGHIKKNSIQVEQYDDSFMFYEIIEKEANEVTLSMMSLVKIASIRSCEQPTLKQRAKEYLDSHPSRFDFLRGNFDSVDWELVAENQINLSKS
jgi:hypothetical protein